MVTILHDSLPPTLTYQRRRWCWISNGTGTVVTTKGEVIPGKGLLTIIVQHAKGYGCNAEIDTYCLEEFPPEEIGTRLFGLLNTTDKEQKDIYLVTVGGLNRCKCQAGKCKVPSGCKHRDAIAALIEAGGLDPEPDVAPAEPPYRDYYAELPPLEPCPF